MRALMLGIIATAKRALSGQWFTRTRKARVFGLDNGGRVLCCQYAPGGEMLFGVSFTGTNGGVAMIWCNSSGNVIHTKQLARSASGDFSERWHADCNPANGDLFISFSFDNSNFGTLYCYNGDGSGVGGQRWSVGYNSSAGGPSVVPMLHANGTQLTCWWRNPTNSNTFAFVTMGNTSSSTAVRHAYATVNTSNGSLRRFVVIESAFDGNIGVEPIAPRGTDDMLINVSSGSRSTFQVKRSGDNLITTIPPTGIYLITDGQRVSSISATGARTGNGFQHSNGSTVCVTATFTFQNPGIGGNAPSTGAALVRYPSGALATGTIVASVTAITGGITPGSAAELNDGRVAWLISSNGAFTHNGVTYSPSGDNDVWLLIGNWVAGGGTTSVTRLSRNTEPGFDFVFQDAPARGLISQLGPSSGIMATRHFARASASAVVATASNPALSLPVGATPSETLAAATFSGTGSIGDA